MRREVRIIQPAKPAMRAIAKPTSAGDDRCAVDVRTSARPSDSCSSSESELESGCPSDGKVWPLIVIGFIHIARQAVIIRPYVGNRFIHKSYDQQLFQLQKS